jgi:RNA polymerase sigma factor (sigma-70 family)
MSPSSGTVDVPATETPIDGPGWSLGSNSGSADASFGRDPITTNGANLSAATLEAPAPPRRSRASDEQLARAARRGDAAAFEALYERHHRPLLSFARHMLGCADDAEDVVQHAFLAADHEFRSGRVPKAVRAWLYTVARNRCVSLLRARREVPGLPDAGMPSTENLAADVERRADLRHLLADLRELPDDQRAALLLAELGDLSHVEVASVIGVRPGKVKALVFQARETLMAAADARAIPCRSIQEELSVATGSALRRRHLRNHLTQCPGCQEYADRVRAQRASLALLLPVVPTLALRDAVLSGLAGSAGAGAGAAAGGIGLLAAKSTGAKLLTIAAVGGAAAGGGTVAITTHDAGTGDRPAERREQRAPATRAPTPATPAVSRAADPGNAREPVPAARRRDEVRSGRKDRATARDKRPAAAGRGGHSNGRKPERAAASTPPGQAKTKHSHAMRENTQAKQLKPQTPSRPKPHELAPARRPVVTKAKPVRPPKARRVPAVAPPAADALGRAEKQAKDAVDGDPVAAG